MPRHISRVKVPPPPDPNEGLSHPVEKLLTIHRPVPLGAMIHLSAFLDAAGWNDAEILPYSPGDPMTIGRRT